MDHRNAASQNAVAHPLKAGSLDHSHEGFLIGEASNAFNEVTIGGTVAGDKGNVKLRFDTRYMKMAAEGAL